MPQPPTKVIPSPNQPSKGGSVPVSSGQSTDICKEMVKFIDALPGGLQTYPIRELVKHSEFFGFYLAQQNVKTNQIRKFLDAINQIKSDLIFEKDLKLDDIEVNLQMLKPKLAYAVARADKRQSKAVSDLKNILCKSIDRIKLVETINVQDDSIKTEENIKEFRSDFSRLVNLIESIIAYHKAAGGE